MAFSAKASASQAGIEVTWDLVNSLGWAGSNQVYKNPIHAELVAAMQSGRLQAILAEGDVVDPKIALKLAYMILPEKSGLAKLIFKTFAGTDFGVELRRAGANLTAETKDEAWNLIQLLTYNWVNLRNSEREAERATYAVATPMASTTQAQQGQAVKSAESTL